MIWKKELFQNWIVTQNTREDTEFFRFDPNNLTDDVFITTFDVNKQKRLIVNGLYRATALTTPLKKGLTSRVSGYSRVMVTR
jgi:hypothetical protein